MLTETFGRKLDRGDDLVRAQICVALWRITRRAMKICKCNRAFAAKTSNINSGIQRRKRHAHVRWRRCDACLAGTEDSVHAVKPVEGRAAAARSALVAGRRLVVEV